MESPSPASVKSRAHDSLRYLTGQAHQKMRQLLTSDQVPAKTRRLLGFGERAVDAFKAMLGNSEEAKGGRGKGFEWLLTVIEARVQEIISAAPEEAIKDWIRKTRDMLSWVVGE